MTAEEFKAMSHVEKIRALSGVIPLSGNSDTDVQIMTSRLGLICLITRVMMGDATEEFLETTIDRLFS